MQSDSISNIQNDSITLIQAIEKELNENYASETIKIYQLTEQNIIAIIIVVLALVIGGYLLVSYLKKKRKQKDSFVDALTERELIVARLLQTNKTNKEIADELFISLSTVKTHINNIYKKLHISNRKEIKTYQF